eukprot:Awhi_evm1s1662
MQTKDDVPTINRNFTSGCCMFRPNAKIYPVIIFVKIENYFEEGLASLQTPNDTCLNIVSNTNTFPSLELGNCQHPGSFAIKGKTLKSSISTLQFVTTKAIWLFVQSLFKGPVQQPLKINSTMSFAKMGNILNGITKPKEI